MKNIKKHYKISAKVALVSLLLLTLSCEDYLQDELLSETSVDFIYSTTEGLELSTVGLYTLNRNLYQSDGLNNSGVPLIPQSKTDLVQPIAGELSFMARQITWGVEQPRVGTKRLAILWQHYYRLIDRANSVITFGADVDFDDEARKKTIIAEAKCFRAHSYFTLYRQFNNIFVTTEPTTPENAFDKPQDKSSVEEIFALLNSDLDDAIQDLEWTTNELGRWTQASARHLKAKVAMWQEDFVEAANQADAIIENGSYGLVATSDVFKDDMNHIENLFSIQYKEFDDISGGGTNQMNAALLAKYDDLSGFKFSIENGGNGAAAIGMNSYLVSLLEEDLNDNRVDGNYYITRFRFNDAETLPEGLTLGDPITFPYTDPVSNRTYDPNSSTKSQRTNFYTNLNPSCVKFRQESADPANANHISNILVYRLAETYLIGAEAHMLSNPGKSLEYYNEIRNRANVTLRTEPVDLQAIMDERARELAFEGQRFYFLKRTGTFLNQVRTFSGDDFGDFDHARRPGSVEDHHVNYPIPIAELNLLGPNYPQNDGYPE